MKRKRQLLFLLLSILSFISLVVLILSLPPDAKLEISNLKLEIIFLFLPLLFFFLFSAGTYLFRSKKHGILIGLFAVIYLLFRLNNLTHPFFFILLAGLFLTLELMVSHKK